MPVYSVTYDLNRPVQNYPKVYEYLQSFSHARPTLSQWLIETSRSIEEITTDLRHRIDSTDVVLILEIQKPWAGLNMLMATDQWLRQRLP